MVTLSTLSQAELLSKLVAVATANSGTALTATDSTITGTLTAIKAKWILGGRKVTSNFRCTLDPASHEAHFQESAMESSWGLPPQTCLTCIETCRACVALLEYDSAMAEEMCEVCEEACEQCAAECTKCGDEPCCKACAEACRKCHDACRAMRR